MWEMLPQTVHVNKSKYWRQKLSSEAEAEYKDNNAVPLEQISQIKALLKAWKFITTQALCIKWHNAVKGSKWLTVALQKKLH